MSPLLGSIQVIGHTVLVKSQSGPDAGVTVERTIVGVIANMRSSGVDTRARSEAYVPYAQHPVAALQIVAEPNQDQDAEAAVEMRAAVRGLRPDLVVEPPRAMDPIVALRAE